MGEFTNPLGNIRIASPCRADWNEMIGDEQKRFCGACKLNVYNLSGMSRREAEDLILQTKGNRLCVRFFKRADGTVLTKDCPVGWQAFKRKVSKTATAFASLIFTAIGGIGLANYFTKPERQMMGTTTESKSVTNSVIPIDASNSDMEIRTAPTSTIETISVPDDKASIYSVGMLVDSSEVHTQIKKRRKR